MKKELPSSGSLSKCLQCQDGAELKLGARNLIQISHGNAKDPTTWAIIITFQAAQWQDAEIGRRADM